MEAADVRGGFAVQGAQSEGLKNAATIRYGLAEEGPVCFTVYDLLGRRVAVLVDGIQTPGKHTVRFEASYLPSGLYLLFLMQGGERLRNLSCS